jgi:Fur family ferric uptake transcriptional regulator
VSRLDVERAGRLLRRAGVRDSAARRRVLVAAAAAEAPQTAEDIRAALEPEEHINKVTVYRTLDLLVDHGVLRRASAGERAFRYCLADPDLGGPGHCHFRCTRCGAMACIPLEAAGVEVSAMRSALGATIEEVDLRVEGVCADCANKEGPA